MIDAYFARGGVSRIPPSVLGAVGQLKELSGTDDLIPLALRWVLMHEAVSVVIPKASKTSQVISNIRAAEIPALTQAQMDGVTKIYNKYLKAEIHNQWHPDKKRCKN